MQIVHKNIKLGNEFVVKTISIVEIVINVCMVSTYITTLMRFSLNSFYWCRGWQFSDSVETPSIEIKMFNVHFSFAFQLVFQSLFCIYYGFWNFNQILLSLFKINNTYVRISVNTVTERVLYMEVRRYVFFVDFTIYLFLSRIHVFCFVSTITFVSIFKNKLTISLYISEPSHYTYVVISFEES